MYAWTFIIYYYYYTEKIKRNFQVSKASAFTDYHLPKQSFHSPWWDIKLVIANEAISTERLFTILQPQCTHAGFLVKYYGILSLIPKGSNWLGRRIKPVEMRAVVYETNIFIHSNSQLHDLNAFQPEIHLCSLHKQKVLLRELYRLPSI